MQSQLIQLTTALADGGAKYAETNLSSFIVEPWNAISSLILLVPGLIWIKQERGKIKENLFLCLCFGLLFLGGLGSTFFHAFRSSSILLQMDVMPMLFLTLCISWYFWDKIISNKIILYLILTTAFLSRLAVSHMDFLSVHTRGNISYFIGGSLFFLPAMLFTRNFGLKKSRDLFLSIFFFSIALLCRELDRIHMDLLPMGTHFLWHIFTAVGGYSLAKFVINIEKESKAVSGLEEEVLVKSIVEV